MDDRKQDFDVGLEQVMQALLYPTIYRIQGIYLSSQGGFSEIGIDPTTVRGDAKSHHLVPSIVQR